jgi:hypothetical protein
MPQLDGLHNVRRSDPKGHHVVFEGVVLSAKTELELAGASQQGNHSKLHGRRAPVILINGFTCCHQYSHAIPRALQDWCRGEGREQPSTRTA